MTEYGPTVALVVVDVQNDFADPGGSLYVSGGEEVVPVINAEIERALAAGAAVIFTQDWHPEVTPHFQIDGGTWPVHCLRDTWGAEFHPGVRTVEGVPVVRKGVDGKDGYSGFSVRDPESGEVEATRLESMLRERGIDRIVIAGLATDYCVVETALDARRLGHPTSVVVAATRAVERRPGNGERALERMREAGVELA